ncbi:putative upf0187 domain protein [Lasiodiplodia theobromae]|uniref:UPF0187 protein n=2 Tax=Lasiodiplodia TaxID=66739 RepID=A0AA39XTZ2_9PEZI|nr:uncharacterized protein LTHEOB_9655 [Lasiodiplodia theobromae]KAB2581327.1 putative membrane protein [Lasiodiplodia theobromae]KAF4539843.1 hypothetical protein LTHEOB_9655 [Lasiodiplodia theobromae]KAF9629538.1 putative upf0187 domain protein [Lasiodiplodia theobromae]KAK0640074.1 UPF0187 protein [Lasiodiplodia hormozganensis]
MSHKQASSYNTFNQTPQRPQRPDFSLLQPSANKRTDMVRHHRRTASMHPSFNVTRTKPRRWPLVLRFIKGAIHGAIFVPVFLHAAFTALIVYLDSTVGEFGLPSSIIPSLSIVVGLMLVFRNGTSYDRFWTGRQLLNECCTAVRNLTRSFLVNSSRISLDGSASGDLFVAGESTPRERADTERAIRVLLATLHAIKHNLRGEYALSGASPASSSHPELAALLPPDTYAHEDRGLGLPLQLLVQVEAYIRRGVARGWFHGPQASQLSVQVNSLTSAYGRMEAIRTTPIPVAHLIHMKQVLALYGCVLPFSLVDEFGWWSILIVAMITFTLYGIDGIGEQLEDPFGYDKNDINMDGIVEDANVECLVLLDEWKRDQGGMFQ